jgi:hypothetical protein
LRSNGLFYVKINRVRVYQSGIKIAGSMMTSDALTPSLRLCEDQVKDGRVDSIGCVGPCYLYFAVFIILDRRRILIF